MRRTLDPQVEASVLHRLDPQVEAIVEARHDNPFAFLGMHRVDGAICVRAMLPAAQQMAVVESATGNIAAEGVRVHRDGFFEATVADRQEPFRYRLRISSGGIQHEFDDVYRFPPEKAVPSTAASSGTDPRLADSLGTRRADCRGCLRST